MSEAETPVSGTAPADSGSVIPEEAPAKPRRRRRTKAEMEAARAAEAAAKAAAEAAGEPWPPKRRRGRPRKADAAELADAQVQPAADAQPADAPKSEADAVPQPKRRRGRPRKSETADAAVAPAQGESAPEAAPAPDTAPAVDAPDQAPAPAGDQREQQPAKDEAPKQGRKRRHSNGAEHAGAKGPNDASSQDRRKNGQGQGQGRRRNRRQQEAAEPSLSRAELLAMKVAELRSKAAELGVDYVGVRKSELVDAVYEAAARAEGFRPVEGILEIGNEGYGWIRTGNYMEGDDDAFVHQQLIRSLGLRPGDRVSGTVGPGRAGGKYPPLQSVITVNGQTTENLKARPRFGQSAFGRVYVRLVRRGVQHGDDLSGGYAGPFFRAHGRYSSRHAKGKRNLTYVHVAVNGYGFIVFRLVFLSQMQYCSRGNGKRDNKNDKSAFHAGHPFCFGMTPLIFRRNSSLRIVYMEALRKYIRLFR